MVLCGYFYFFFSPSLKWLMNSYNQWLKNFWTECLCSQKKLCFPDSLTQSMNLNYVQLPSSGTTLRKTRTIKDLNALPQQPDSTR